MSHAGADVEQSVWAVAKSAPYVNVAVKRAAATGDDFGLCQALRELCATRLVGVARLG